MADTENRLVVEATAENKAKLESKIKSAIMAILLQRKRLVREIEQLDEAISALDKKVIDLTTAYDEGKIIEAREVEVFMQGGCMLPGIVTFDVETTGMAMDNSSYQNATNRINKGYKVNPIM